MCPPKILQTSIHSKFVFLALTVVPRNSPYTTSNACYFQLGRVGPAPRLNFPYELSRVSDVRPWCLRNRVDTPAIYNTAVGGFTRIAGASTGASGGP